jgi:SAM-dependent methyltransferase
MASNAPQLHPGAQSGFQAASSYDAHRPSYPPEAFQKLLEVTNLLPSQYAQKTKRVVLDLAAGTGKMTVLLASHRDSLRSSESDLDIDLVAVEPHEDMRKELERKELPEVKVLVGTADDLPFKPNSLDVVIAAQVRWIDRVTAKSHWIRHFIGSLPLLL